VSSPPRSDPLDLSGRRIFITGGTGFLGRTLLDYFAESAASHGSDFDVTVMSRAPESFLARHPQYAGAGWLRFVAGDLTRFAPPEPGTTDVLHAAADTHGVDDKAAWIDQIVGGTRAALDWAIASGATRFLLTSSGAVYGPQPADLARIAESHAGAPSTTSLGGVYGQAKRVAEQLCTVYAKAHALSPVIARCFAFTGPHLAADGPYAIGNFIRDALAGLPIHVQGDGLAVRSYLYGRDMAHWLVTLMLHGEPGRAYNVGSDQATTIAALAETVARVLAPGTPVVIGRRVADDGVRSVYVPDIGQAAALGLSVQTPLDEAIRLTARSWAAR
jgi:UDP-glucuronate decarboxylase